VEGLPSTNLTTKGVDLTVGPPDSPSTDVPGHFASTDRPTWRRLSLRLVRCRFGAEMTNVVASAEGVEPDPVQPPRGVRPLAGYLDADGVTEAIVKVLLEPHENAVR
jgi:hypothetical protein